MLDLEHTFVNQCMNDGALLETTQLASNLSVSKATAQRYIDMFVARHLVYRLPSFGYGKDVLRGKFKLYLADPAIAPGGQVGFHQGPSGVDNPPTFLRPNIFLTYPSTRLKQKLFTKE